MKIDDEVVVDNDDCGGYFVAVADDDNYLLGKVVEVQM